MSGEHQNQDREITLLIPERDVADPVLSIVIPAMNEEITIGQFIDWCHQGIARLDVATEILIIDSSSDRTADLAVAAGARVLKTPKRGLGRAYIDAIPFIRGKYAIFGDADCTYDFRTLTPFFEKLEAGFEFVMGSRFAGSIEDGAMPGLHRHFGTPLTTFILNVMYRTSFTDIHCGMRAITVEAFKRMNMRSQSWEYASEMILKSVHMKLRTAEVPVHFLKDPDGRVSHHARMGWFSPWSAGWINLKAMFIYGADFFLMRPGIALLLTGLAVLALLGGGPVQLGRMSLALNTMLLALVTGTVGLQLFLAGIIAQCIYDQHGARRRRWLRLLPYTRTTVACFLLFLAGFGLSADFVTGYVAAGYHITPDMLGANHRAIIGLFAIIGSVHVFIATLLVHAVVRYLPAAPGAER